MSDTLTNDVLTQVKDLRKQRDDLNDGAYSVRTQRMAAAHQPVDDIDKQIGDLQEKRGSLYKEYEKLATAVSQDHRAETDRIEREHRDAVLALTGQSTVPPDTTTN